MKTRSILSTLAAILLCTTAADGQFRRGMFGESHEVTLFPIQPPATLLPPGSVEVRVRNLTGASARIVERMRDSLERQLTSNDTRLTVVDKNADVTITATLTEWSESRRNSTKYVSETRQIGTRQVKDKDGKMKTEPIYEYGRNRPSVVVSGAAGVRLEVQRRAGAPMADETARHTVQEEHLLDASPPSRDAVEDQLLDNLVQKAAGQISPGRFPVRVLLARSSEVDPFNELAKNRRWNEWLKELQTVKPNRDRKRDAYRFHNVAVAHEALAYEAATPEESLEELTQASRLIGQAALLNNDEKYIAEAAERIARSTAAYQRLATMYAQLTDAPPPPPAPAPSQPARGGAVEKAPAADKPATATALTNKDIIDLAAAGLDDENLIASVNDAKAVSFDLTPAGLKALLAGKVSNRVINAMRARAKK